MNDVFRELCIEVLAYNEGQGKYNFSHLSPYDRDNAAFDAWQDIKAKIKDALAGFSKHPFSELSDEEFTEAVRHNLCTIEE